MLYYTHIVFIVKLCASTLDACIEDDYKTCIVAVCEFLL